MEIIQTLLDLVTNIPIGDIISLGIFGIGGSKQKSSSSSFSTTQSQDQVFKPLAQATKVFEGEQAFSRFQEQGLGNIRAATSELFNRGTNFLGSISRDSAARTALEQRITGTGFADERVDLLGEDLGRFFREELLTGISRGSTSNNTQGGSRQGVAESLAAREVAQQFTRGAIDIRQKELDSRAAASKDLLGIDIAGAQTGIAGLSELQNVITEAETLDLKSAGILADIIGDPTILNFSRGESSSRQKGKASGFDIGF